MISKFCIWFLEREGFEVVPAEDDSYKNLPPIQGPKTLIQIAMDNMTDKLAIGLFNGPREAYDPSLDEMKTLKGENESYFE